MSARNAALGVASPHVYSAITPPGSYVSFVLEPSCPWLPHAIEHYQKTVIIQRY